MIPGQRIKLIGRVLHEGLGYQNTNTQIQLHKYNYTNTNTQIQIKKSNDTWTAHQVDWAHPA